ncbi:hypothetical protein CYLTODRAFT_95220 [Cylindrobasidium torrendii FP15055 ss-10]|uniref:Uncharacterized protein n=1 Tax=Cylindrobasidium torrendii FP15055 ss-10 TaxID=1314674 RepID=A0A0D7BUU9_9AGAR|nr:hypothetical protein CYLTODRAFT_95220 [Cylindrobasidium torrendii FP15055 ss-10]
MDTTLLSCYLPSGAVLDFWIALNNGGKSLEKTEHHLKIADRTIADNSAQRSISGILNPVKRTKLQKLQLCFRYCPADDEETTEDDKPMLVFVSSIQKSEQPPKRSHEALLYINPSQPSSHHKSSIDRSENATPGLNKPRGGHITEYTVRLYRTTEVIQTSCKDGQEVFKYGEMIDIEDNEEKEDHPFFTVHFIYDATEGKHPRARRAKGRIQKQLVTKREGLRSKPNTKKLPNTGLGRKGRLQPSTYINSSESQGTDESRKRARSPEDAMSNEEGVKSGHPAAEPHIDDVHRHKRARAVKPGPSTVQAPDITPVASGSVSPVRVPPANDNRSLSGAGYLTNEHNRNEIQPPASPRHREARNSLGALEPSTPSVPSGSNSAPISSRPSVAGYSRIRELLKEKQESLARQEAQTEYLGNLHQELEPLSNQLQEKEVRDATYIKLFSVINSQLGYPTNLEDKRRSTRKQAFSLGYIIDSGRSL